MTRAYSKNFNLAEIFNDVYDEDGQFLYTAINEAGVLVPSNSSETALGGGIAFTGAAFDVTEESIVFVSVFSDVASATDGLSIQQSKDGTNWYWTDDYTVPAGAGKTYSIQPALPWMRIVYTNGAGAQSSFNLATLTKKNLALDSSHRIQDPIVDDDDARLRKSVLTAKKDSGTFSNIGATDSGNLRTTDAENGLSIAKGDVAGHSFIHKFGLAFDIDTADNHCTIWDGADDATIAQMVYQYSATADIDRLSSSSASDTVDIEIQGLDSNYDVVTQTITLTGQAPVALTTSLIRVFRMKNVGAANLVGNVFCFVDSATSGGIPTTTANVRAMIHNGSNQTLMAVYTIPAGFAGYLRDWYVSTAGASKSSNYTIRLRARPFGQVFQVKHQSAISDGGTSAYQHSYNEPEVFAEKTDIELTARMTATGGTGAAIAGGFDIVLVAT